MKKFFVLLFTIIFASCSKTVYVNSQSGEKFENMGVRDFINLEILETGVSSKVLVDKNSGCLYYKHMQGITPIMKPDGTCLTYSEWQQRELGGVVSGK